MDLSLSLESLAATDSANVIIGSAIIGNNMGSVAMLKLMLKKIQVLLFLLMQESGVF